MHMGWSWWCYCPNKRSFGAWLGHITPSNTPVVGVGVPVPIGESGIVALAGTRSLVVGARNHRFRQALQIPVGVVEIIFTVLVWLLSKWRCHMEMRSLKYHLLPRVGHIGTPINVFVLFCCSFVPSACP